MIDSVISKSLSILLAVGLSYCELVASGELPNQADNSATAYNRVTDKCCQIGRERAIELQKSQCKLSARDAFADYLKQPNDRTNHLLALSADALLMRDQNLSDQCEMLLESCCLAVHRTRNCESGKQFAKSGATCMDVELSKEATLATESFNDCCMTCSLGVLAARTNDSSITLQDRCKIATPLAMSLSGQLYEQAYIECCQENLPKPSGALIDTNAPIDCSQSHSNACSQRCTPAGSVDPITRHRVERDQCDCYNGYKLAQDQVTCVDIDECSTNLHTCNKQSEICDNTRGSFRCLARNHKLTLQTNFNRPQARSLQLDDSNASPPHLLSSSELAITQKPFAWLRMCPPGTRWSTHNNSCHQVELAANAPLSNESPSVQSSVASNWNSRNSTSRQSSYTFGTSSHSSSARRFSS